MNDERHGYLVPVTEQWAATMYQIVPAQVKLVSRVFHRHDPRTVIDSFIYLRELKLQPYQNGTGASRHGTAAVPPPHHPHAHAPRDISPHTTQNDQKQNGKMARAQE